MSVGKIIDVDRSGSGVALTIEVEGSSEYVFVFLDEAEAAERGVEILDRLEQGPRQAALDRALGNLREFIAERFVAALRPKR